MRITSSVWAAETMQHPLMHCQRHCYEQNEHNNAHLGLLIAPNDAIVGIESLHVIGRELWAINTPGILVRPGPSNRATPQKTAEIYGFLTSHDVRERPIVGSRHSYNHAGAGRSTPLTRPSSAP
jgi:hypothetical protein